ncbi:MAG: class I SAM-dependent methyltransferase [bacterium]
MSYEYLRNIIKKYFFLPATKYRYILKGVGTYLPKSVMRFLPEHQHQFYNYGSIRKQSGDARTFYSLWLRQLVILFEQKVPINKIKNVAEFGAGDSLGVGLAAIISGVDKYYAIDISKNAFSSHNLEIFDQIVELFKKKEPIPDNKEFPKAIPILKSYKFPSYILTDDVLKTLLDENRIQKIRQALRSVIKEERIQQDKISIQYIVLQNDLDIIKKESLDLIYSFAVMEHVDNFREVYNVFNLWLKNGGLMAHAVGYNSHNTARLWNGHWTYSDFAWKLIRGRCHYLINREPHSAQINYIKEAGFQVIFEDKYYEDSMISKKDVVSRFKNISEDDLKTHSAFIVARKL